MTYPNSWRATHQPDGTKDGAQPGGEHATAKREAHPGAGHAPGVDETSEPARSAAAAAIPITRELGQGDAVDPADTQPSLPASHQMPGFVPLAPATILPGPPLTSGPLDNPAHGMPSSPADSFWRPRIPRPGAKILIVENEYTNLRLMEHILAFAGYECVSASNGQAALEVFERERPDLILTDIAMPVMDGLAVTAALRARPHGARIPIVAVSAHAMPEDRDYALRHGCTAYLTKPYKPHDLLELVERLLREGRG